MRAVAVPNLYTKSKESKIKDYLLSYKYKGYSEWQFRVPWHSFKKYLRPKINHN